MSPRAALRLEHLGFEDVYDYVAGKNDWLAAGLEREGDAAAIPFASDVLVDVPTCHFREPLSDALRRLHDSGSDFAVAVTDDDIVMGKLRPDASGKSVEEAMTPGSTTTRGNEPASSLLERLEGAGVDSILVTNAEGRLMGLFTRDAARRSLQESHRHHHGHA